MMGGISALGAALVSIGIPKNNVLQYEACLKAGKFLLILHATPQEVERAKDRLDDTQAMETTIHTNGRRRRVNLGTWDTFLSVRLS